MMADMPELMSDNIYKDQVSKTERLLLEAGYEGTIFFTNPSYEDLYRLEE